MSKIRQVARQNKTMLQKTGSYYVMHIGVAALVAYAVTGNFWAALTLSLLEPTVQAVAFFFHEKAWGRRLAAQGGVMPNKTMLQKTASYYAVHVVVASLVAYGVTGNFWAALTLSLLEPTVQAVAFFFHEKAWARRMAAHDAANRALKPA